MDQGYLLSRDSADRLSRMLNAFERDRLGPVHRPDRGDFGYGRTGSITQTVQVTGAAISAGYYPGKVRNWNNTTQAWVDGPACRIREASGGALANGSIHTDAKLVGQDTVSGVNYLVFQVSPKSGSTGSTIRYGQYQGGDLVWNGVIWATPVWDILNSGIYYIHDLWGLDVKNAYQATVPRGISLSSNWQCIFKENPGTPFGIGTVLSSAPLIIPAEVSYWAYASTGMRVVQCRGITTGNWAWSANFNFTFVALDYSNLVPLTGIYRANLAHQRHAFFGAIGWQVISVNLNAPVNASPGVSLSGASFPSGMGGGFPGPNTAGTSEVV